MTVGFLEDFFWGFGPDEGVFAVVPAGDELSDFGVEVFDGCEDTSADSLPVDDAEPHLDKIQSGSRRGCEMHVEPGVPSEPFFDFGGFMGGIVIHHQV